MIGRSSTAAGSGDQSYDISLPYQDNSSSIVAIEKGTYESETSLILVEDSRKSSVVRMFRKTEKLAQKTEDTLIKKSGSQIFGKRMTFLGKNSAESSPKFTNEPKPETVPKPTIFAKDQTIKITLPPEKPAQTILKSRSQIRLKPKTTISSRSNSACGVHAPTTL